MSRLGAAVGMIMAAAVAVVGRAEPASTGKAGSLATVRSWAYQLQSIDLDALARSPFDLLVIDYSLSGEDRRRLTPAEVRRLQRRPDGRRRIVLAYMSIGEAEDYRFYWSKDWLESAEAASGAPKAAPPQPPRSDETESDASPPTERWLSASAPPWLHAENEQWSGNFLVHFWDRAWQDVIFGKPASYLARIMDAGFDGVYLDRVDAYYEFQDERPQAGAEMVDFVVRLSAFAKSARPGFLVVAQNGEELLVNPAYLAAIDAIAKEDLLFGSPDEGAPNSPAQIANSLTWLGSASRAGRRVLVVEYLDDTQLIAEASAELERLGFVAYFAPRLLDRLVLPATQAPPAARRGPAR